MTIPRSTWRWTALIGLWILAGAICWLVAIQIFIALVSPFGTWQRPGIARVTILRVDQDEQSSFTDNVLVKEGEAERTLCMLKGECGQLKPEDEIWVLNNYYSTPLRPTQFRLTPVRLLVEYPEPLLLLALWLIWHIRRSQARAKVLEEMQTGTRVPFRDDFHSRSERFAASKEPGKE